MTYVDEILENCFGTYVHLDTENLVDSSENDSFLCIKNHSHVLLYLFLCIGREFLRTGGQCYSN